MDASYFDTRYKPHPARHRVWKAICEYLQRFVPASSVVIDIGPGYCDFINQIQARTKYAVDINPDVAQWVAPNVRFIKTTSIESIDLPDHSLDVVMISNVLEHLSIGQCSALFDRLNDLFAANGKLIVIQPNYFYCYRRYWDDFTHVR